MLVRWPPAFADFARGFAPCTSDVYKSRTHLAMIGTKTEWTKAHQFRRPSMPNRFQRNGDLSFLRATADLKYHLCDGERNFENHFSDLGTVIWNNLI